MASPQFISKLHGILDSLCHCSNLHHLPQSSPPPATPPKNSSSSRSGLTGVTLHKRTQRYEARLWCDKKQVYLGAYRCSLLAAAAHDIMALKVPAATIAALNFTRDSYEAIIPLLESVSQHEVIKELRNYSKSKSAAERRRGGGGGRAGMRNNNNNNNANISAEVVPSFSEFQTQQNSKDTVTPPSLLPKPPPALPPPSSLPPVAAAQSTKMNDTTATNYHHAAAAAAASSSHLHPAPQVFQTPSSLLSSPSPLFRGRPILPGQALGMSYYDKVEGEERGRSIHDNTINIISDNKKKGAPTVEPTEHGEGVEKEKEKEKEEEEEDVAVKRAQEELMAIRQALMAFKEGGGELIGE